MPLHVPWAPYEPVLYHHRTVSIDNCIENRLQVQHVREESLLHGKKNGTSTQVCLLSMLDYRTGFLSMPELNSCSEALDA